jgi:TolB-like protein
MLKGFLSELKRRKVVRAVIAYAIAAWVVIQAAGPLVDVLMLPEWTPRLVFALTVLGLPVAIGLAWAFDWGPRGLERTGDHEAAGGPSATEAAAETPARSTIPAAWKIAVVGAVAVLALAGGAFLMWDPGSADGELPRDHIVVLPFENRTGDPALDPLGRLAADWVTQGIIRAGLGTVLPLNDVLATLGVPDVDLTEISASEAGRATGAGTVVEGSYYLAGDSVELQARVVDVRRGRVLESLDPVRGSAADPGAAVEELRDRVGGFLATLFDPRGLFASDSSLPTRPPTLQAYTAYADAQDRFLRFDFDAAIWVLNRAIELDSTFIPSKLVMAVAHLNRGRHTVADSITTELLAEPERLTLDERLRAEFIRAMSRGDRSVAMDRSARLAEMFPNSHFHYQAGNDGVLYNRPRRATHYLSTLDPTRGPMARWPPYWSVYRNAHHLLGEHTEELQVARRALETFGEPERVVSFQIQPLAAMGRFVELRDALAQTERYGVGMPADGLREAALELRAHGFADSADTYLREALDWYGRQSEAERERLKEAIVYTLYVAGRPDSAGVLYHGLLTEAPEPVDDRSRARVRTLRGRLGTIAAGLGDTEAAGRTDAWLRDVDWPLQRGSTSLWRARIAAQLGEPDRAVALLRQAFSEGATFGVWVHRDPDLILLADHPGFQALLRPGDEP